jgi:hypothetical protein
VLLEKLKLKIKKENAPNAPGMLSKHYAPRLFLKVMLIHKGFPEKNWIITFKDKIESTTVIHKVCPKRAT